MAKDIIDQVEPHIRVNVFFQCQPLHFLVVIIHASDPPHPKKKPPRGFPRPYLLPRRDW